MDSYVLYWKRLRLGNERSRLYELLTIRSPGVSSRDLLIDSSLHDGLDKWGERESRKPLSITVHRCRNVILPIMV